MTDAFVVEGHQDPVAYRKLSERLRDLLEKLGEQWDELTTALKGLIDEIRVGHVANDERLPELPEHYGPFVRMMVDAAACDQPITEAERALLVDLSVEVVDTVAAELTPNFWKPHRRPAQAALNARIFELLMRSRLLPTPQIEALVDRLMVLMPVAPPRPSARSAAAASVAAEDILSGGRTPARDQTHASKIQVPVVGVAVAQYKGLGQILGVDQV